MNIIPQRLFSDSHVEVILRDFDVAILRKKLTKSLINREGYIASHVISILISGEQHIRTYDDELIKILPKQLLFLPRGLYTVSDLLPKEGEFESILFYFDDAILSEFVSNFKNTNGKSENEESYLRLEVASSIQQFVNSLLKMYSGDFPNNKAILKLKILELLHLMVQNKSKVKHFFQQMGLPKKRNVKLFMQDNFDKPLKVEDYAYLTGRSLSSFRRDFKLYYNTTPQNWLKKQRLDKALSILEEKSVSVTELSYAVGYDNVSYFIKAFKKRTGKTPKQYILELHRNLV